MVSIIIDFFRILISKRFDAVYYLAKYDDVRHADINPLLHFVRIGWKEGRNPSAEFVTSDYLKMNPELLAGKVNPLVHFMLHGNNNLQNFVSLNKEDYFSQAVSPVIQSSPQQLVPKKSLHKKTYCYQRKDRNKQYGIEIEDEINEDKLSQASYVSNHEVERDIETESNGSAYKAEYDQALQNAQNQRGADYVEDITENLESSTISSTSVKLIPFYLPQFYPFKENDQWWGKGFTEWTNVSKAIPQFIGHHQPRLPGELGFYDLRLPEVQEQQVSLAKKYGIYGFCFHYYWFGGKHLLDLPLNNYINNPKIDFPFSICWANENWTRRWDGLEDDILIGQEHTFENDRNFIHDIMHMITDDRYIRYQNRPIIIVYRPMLMKDPIRTVDYWRDYAYKQGAVEPYFIAARSFGLENPEMVGFDASVEFHPHNNIYSSITHKEVLLNEAYKGIIFDYREMVEKNIYPKKDQLPRFRTVVPSWDNEARKPGQGNSMHYSTPRQYQRWLEQVGYETLIKFDNDNRFVFVNAWNEWGEGAYLEPDRHFGYAYLRATKNALENISSRKLLRNDGSLSYSPKKNHKVAVILHVHYPEVVSEISNYLSNLTEGFDMFVSTNTTKMENLDTIFKHFPDAQVMHVDNRGRDIGPFIEIFRIIYDLGYERLLKIHTKKSAHRIDGEIWRHDMLDKLLSPDAIRVSQTIVNQDKSVAIIGPQGHVLDYHVYWQSNEQNTYAIAREMGITNPEEITFNFVGGSMFWAQPEALKFLLTMPRSLSDFEEEPIPPDGMLSHAMERLICLVTVTQGYKILEIDSSGRVNEPLANAEYALTESTSPGS